MMIATKRVLLLLIFLFAGQTVEAFQPSSLIAKLPSLSTRNCRHCPWLAQQQQQPQQQPPLFASRMEDDNMEPSATTVAATPITTGDKQQQQQSIAAAGADTSPNRNDAKPATYYDTIIAGGGPAGLLAAIALAQIYGPQHRIAVCERRAALPPSPSADNTLWNDEVARFYLLGIGHRGQAALQHFGSRLFDDFCKASVEVQGRRDWQPGQTRVEEGTISPSTKNPPSRVLAREKLVGVLYEHLVQNYIAIGDNRDPKENISNNNNGAPANKDSSQQHYQIDLLYGYQVEPLDFGTHESDPVTVRISKCEPAAEESINTRNNGNTNDNDDEMCDVEASTSVVATTNFLIGADGAARTVAKAMAKVDQERYRKTNPLRRLLAPRPFRIKEFPDDNPRVYKSVPIRLPPDWPRGLNYSARSRQNSRITLEALPSDDKGTLCALLLMRPHDELAQPNVEPRKLRAFFDAEFPQFGALVDDEEMTRVAQKPASRLPVFRFAGPRLHLGARTLVLGDAAHTVKPYYGLGANTALEDVQVLAEILKEVGAETVADSSTSPPPPVKVVPHAVKEFSNRRARDADALVTISRNMDRPGKWFLVCFLLPLILDGIFHKLAPQIFGPNMFKMFQQKRVGFKQIQRKKRLDRVLQLLCIGSLLTGAGMALKAALHLVAQATGRRPSTVLLLAILFGLAAKKSYGRKKPANSASQ